MKKKLFSALLAVGMLFAMAPAALAATTTDPVVATKTKSGPDSDGNYTITLTAQGATDSSTTITTVPADVVLVVDTSGSMKWCGGELEITDNDPWGNPTKAQCTVCGEMWRWYDFSGIPSYCKAETDRKINAAKAAATSFVEGLLTEGSKFNVGLADFSGQNHTKVSLTSDAAALKSAISELDADHSDGTSYNAGLQAASDILKDAESQNKYIVFISDGEPKNGNDGTQIANQLRQQGIKVYTIGMDITDAAAAKLKAISTADSYYYSSSTDALSQVLESIKNEIVTSIPAGTDAVMKDVVNTKYFEFVEFVGSADEDVSYDSASATITWDIGDLDSTKKEVSFKIRIKDSASKDPEAYGEVHTNASVDLTYTDAAEEEASKDKTEIGDPTVDLYKVIYNDGANGDVFAECFDSALTALPAAAQKEDPVRDHYKFTSWKQEDSEDGYVRTFTAQWEAETYTVTYNDGVDGEEVFADRSYQAAYNSDTPAFDASGKDPLRKGYLFAGWRDQEGNAPAEKVTGNVTYYALWKEVLVPTQSPSAPADPTPAPTPTDEHPEIAQLIAEGKWGGTPTPTKTATVPQTSDNSNPMLWVVMLVLAAAGLAGVVVLKKRQHNK